MSPDPDPSLSEPGLRALREMDEPDEEHEEAADEGTKDEQSKNLDKVTDYVEASELDADKAAQVVYIASLNGDADALGKLLALYLEPPPAAEEGGGEEPPLA